jgi:raffinose/stachyose/melibiose transport system substrate-binding protein
MKLKARTGLALVPIMIMALPAGAGASTSPDRAALTPAGPTGGCHLHVLGETRTSSAETAAWQSVFTAFQAKYHCAVSATWEGEFTNVPEVLNEDRLAGLPVDIVTNGTTNYDLASSGSLLDLTKLVVPYADHFEPGTLSPFTLDGRLWGVPIEPETSSVIFYNASLFKKLALSAPTTFAQMDHDASVIKAKTKVAPMVEGGSDTWEWPMWYMATFAQTSGNNSVQDTDLFLEGKQQFTTPASVQALGDIAAFAKDGLLTEDALAVSEDGANAAFLQGKAAMMMDGTWDLPTLRQAHPAFTLGTFVFPLVVDKKGVVAQANGSPSEGLSIPSSIPKGDIAMADQFLEFVSTPKEANAIQSTLDPVVPTIKGVTPANDSLSAALRQDLTRTNGWLDWIWPADVVTSVENGIEGVLFSHTSPEAAAKSVQAELNTLRQTQGYTLDFWDKWSSAQKAQVEPSPVPRVQVQN